MTTRKRPAGRPITEGPLLRIYDDRQAGRLVLAPGAVVDRHGRRAAAVQRQRDDGRRQARAARRGGRRVDGDARGREGGAEAVDGLERRAAEGAARTRRRPRGRVQQVEEGDRARARRVARPAARARLRRRAPEAARRPRVDELDRPIGREPRFHVAEAPLEFTGVGEVRRRRGARFDGGLPPFNRVARRRPGRQPPVEHGRLYPKRPQRVPEARRREDAELVVAHHPRVGRDAVPPRFGGELRGRGQVVRRRRRRRRVGYLVEVPERAARHARRRVRRARGHGRREGRARQEPGRVDDAQIRLAEALGEPGHRGDAFSHPWLWLRQTLST